MAKTEAQIIAEIQRSLSDAATATYSTALIHLCMRDALFTMAEYIPNICLATVTTIAGTAEVNVGTAVLTNLLYGTTERSFEAVEFAVDKVPRKLRNFSVTAGKLIMDIDFSPSAGEHVRLYVKKPHECYDSTGVASTTTLDTELERIMVKLTKGIVQEEYAANTINKVNIGGGKAYIDFLTAGSKSKADAINELKRVRKAQITIQHPREA